MLEVEPNFSGVLTSKSDLSAIVSSFPSCTICHAVGYGSGVFAQSINNGTTVNTMRNSNSGEAGLRPKNILSKGLGETSLLEPPLETSAVAVRKSSSPLIDLILVVQDAKQFHEKNMMQNAMHYSSLVKYVLGSSGATILQNIGPGAFFNPYCYIAGLEVKDTRANRALGNISSTNNQISYNLNSLLLLFFCTQRLNMVLFPKKNY
jgi:hypothetical protein